MTTWRSSPQEKIAHAGPCTMLKRSDPSPSRVANARVQPFGSRTCTARMEAVRGAPGEWIGARD